MFGDLCLDEKLSLKKKEQECDYYKGLVWLPLERGRFSDNKETQGGDGWDDGNVSFIDLNGSYTDIAQKLIKLHILCFFFLPVSMFYHKKEFLKRKKKSF